MCLNAMAAFSRLRQTSWPCCELHHHLAVLLCCSLRCQKKNEVSCHWSECRLLSRPKGKPTPRNSIGKTSLIGRVPNPVVLHRASKTEFWKWISTFCLDTSDLGCLGGAWIRLEFSTLMGSTNIIFCIFMKRRGWNAPFRDVKFLDP